MALDTESQTAQRLRRTLCDQAVAIRERKRTVELEWLDNRRVYMDRDNRKRYIPDNAIPRTIPSARRVTERTITRCVEMIMPDTGKRFNIFPTVSVPQQTLTNVDAYLQHVYKRKIPTRSNISQLTRCCILYGRPILKTSVRVYQNQVWPVQRVVDPFAFYIFPETAATFEEAELIFEDYLFSYERYAAMARKLLWLDDLSVTDLTSPTWPYHITERLAQQGLAEPSSALPTTPEHVGRQLERTTLAFVSMTEFWVYREDTLYQVYVVWNCTKGPRIVGFIKSLYDEPLYKTINHRPLPGETYTTSQFADIKELDRLQNDQLNKFQDAVDWEQGFIATGDPSRKESWRMKGRTIWDTNGDPREVLNFVQTPQTSTNQLRAWQIYLGLMNSMGGAGTIAEGQPGRNMPRAGFAVQDLITLGMADINDIAKLIESEVLTPSVQDVYSTTRFIPDSQLMLIPGATTQYGPNKSSILKKSDLLGSFEFEWIGSVQYQNQGLRQQQVLMFLNMLANPIMTQNLAQQGHMVNFVELTKMVWRYVLGERGLTDILVPVNIMPQSGPGQFGQGQQGQSQPGQQQQGQQGIPSTGLPSLQPPQPTLNGRMQ